MDRDHGSFLASIHEPMSSILFEVSLVTRDVRSKKIFILLFFNIVTSLLITSWSKYSDSVCLTILSTFLWIDVLSLLTVLLGFWVELKKPNKIFTFGHVRCEILFVFVITIVAFLSALLTCKECFVRLSNQPVISSSYMTPGVLVTIFSHLMNRFWNDHGKAFNHVFSFSSSNFAQEQLSRLSRWICQSVPGLSSVLLPRLNSFVVFLSLSSILTLITDIIINTYESNFADTLFGFIMAILLIMTVLPLASFTGKILLQTTPIHMISHVDKCLREASTMDGVLEFRNEHFWSLGYNNLVGTIHVRVRRDANEQVVLSHLTNRLSNLVSNLTIQVFKDEWSWQNSSPSRLLRQTDSTSVFKYSLPSGSSLLNSSPVMTPSALSSSSTMTSIHSTSISLPPSASVSGLGVGVKSNSGHNSTNHVRDWLQNV